MRILLIFLTLIAGGAWAANGSILADTSGDVEESVSLPHGCGTLRLSKNGDASGSDDDFGGGTVTLKEFDGSGSWSVVDTFTVAPDPNPKGLDFGGVAVAVGVSMASSTSPDLYWEIRSGLCR